MKIAYGRPEYVRQLRDSALIHSAVEYRQAIALLDRNPVPGSRSLRQELLCVSHPIEEELSRRGIDLASVATVA